ncbi:VapC toxin family PIN domain ribonuclease [Paramagnetospirillum kuznetsovii]|uniref:Ribonuclease VapC n=1 Tax=Paramagnetospirillum kuznetsovii TaxID=2053833 RepID=A0A364P2U9_9PROT|nr:type II toxin-antitoxin system VapC family toxin [Paramagnetospirillum kuznetsovii]RAU23616.1 VapC toxin family PIN domain ribonuclease [Paramagnetospirillum kuznetsovii]
MIAVDTSALIAILLNEPDCRRYLDRLQRAERALISTVSAVEARMVGFGRFGPRAVVLLDDLMRMPGFEVVAPGPAEMDAAFNAFVLYGKGSGHPAGLNFGDVFAYALAKTRNLPLLFKGDDFSRTDLTAAL